MVAKTYRPCYGFRDFYRAMKVRTKLKSDEYPDWHQRPIKWLVARVRIELAELELDLENNRGDGSWIEAADVASMVAMLALRVRAIKGEQDVDGAPEIRLDGLEQAGVKRDA